MKNWILLIAMSFLFVAQGSAQKEQTLFGKTGLRLTGAWGGSSTNFSKFGDDYGFFNGGYGVLEFNKALQIGWGGFKLQNDVNLDVDQVNFDMRYNGLMLGYSFFPEKVVHPKILLMGGTGEIDLGADGSDKIFVFKPGLGVEVNVFRWFRLGLEGGYRFVGDTSLPSVSDADFSSAYGAVKLKFGFSWGRTNSRDDDTEARR